MEFSIRVLIYQVHWCQQNIVICGKSLEAKHNPTLTSKILTHNVLCDIDASFIMCNGNTRKVVQRGLINIVFPKFDSVEVLFMKT
jgi:hypothetical protein